MRVRKLKGLVGLLLVGTIAGNLGLPVWAQAQDKPEEIIQDLELQLSDGQTQPEEELLDEAGLDPAQDLDLAEETLDLPREPGLVPAADLVPAQELDWEEDLASPSSLEEDLDQPVGEGETRLEVNVTSWQELYQASQAFSDQIKTVIINLQNGTIQVEGNDSLPEYDQDFDRPSININLEEDQKLLIKNGSFDGDGPKGEHELFNISDENQGELAFENIKFVKNIPIIFKLGEEGSVVDRDQTIYMDNVDFIESPHFKYGDYLIESYVDLNLVAKSRGNLTFHDNHSRLIRARGNLKLQGFGDINIQGNILDGMEAYRSNEIGSNENKVGLINLYKDFAIEDSKNLNIIGNLTEKYEEMNDNDELKLYEKYYNLFKSEEGDKDYGSRMSHATENFKIEVENNINISDNQAGINFLADQDLKLKADNILYRANRYPDVSSDKDLLIDTRYFLIESNYSMEVFGFGLAKIEVGDFLAKNNDHVELGAIETLDFNSANDISLVNNITSRGIIHSDDYAFVKAQGNIDYINNIESDIASAMSARFLDIKSEKNINFIGNTWNSGAGFLEGRSTINMDVAKNLNIIGNLASDGSHIYLMPRDDIQEKSRIRVGQSLNLLRNTSTTENLALNLSTESGSSPIDEILTLDIEHINMAGNLMPELDEVGEQNDEKREGGLFTSQDLGVARFINALGLYDFEKASYTDKAHKKGIFLANSELTNPSFYGSSIVNLLTEDEDFLYPNMTFTNLKFKLNGGRIISPDLGPSELDGLEINLSNQDLIKLNKIDGLRLEDFKKPGYKLKEIRLNDKTLTGYSSQELAQTLTKEIKGLELIRNFDNLLYYNKLVEDQEDNGLGELKDPEDLKLLVEETSYLKSLEDFSLDILNRALAREDSSLEFIWELEDKPVDPKPNPGGGGDRPGGGSGGDSDGPSRDRGEVIEPKIEFELNKVDHLAYLKGYKDQSIKPDGKLTRAEAAMVFYRLMEEEFRQSVQTQEHNFKDVEDGKWYTKAVASLAKAGMVSGYKDGTFKPGQQITRAELASMIAKLTDTAIHPTEFKDIVEHWAEDYINSAQKAGWLKGYEDGSFKPNDLISRSEFATITNSILDRKVLRENILPGIKNFKDLKDTSWYYEIMVEAANGHKYEVVDGVEIWKELDKREFE